MTNHVDSPTYISLYSGGGGLDLGFKLAVPGARCVCYVERDAAAIALLVDHMQTGQLDDAPLWSDSGTFDGKPWRGKVDFIIGGFPCQPFSVAGQRAGTDDDRWLWPHIERLVGEIRPGGVFLENVPGLFHGGIEHVLGGLASLGYDAEWICVRASDVGAPHRRERVFILAHDRRCRLTPRGRIQGNEAEEGGGWSDIGGTDDRLADTSTVSGQVPQAGGADGTGRVATAGASRELARSNDESIDALERGVRPELDRDGGNVAHAGHDAGCAEHGQQHDAGSGSQTAGAGQSGEGVGDTPIDGLQESERRINGLRTGSKERNIELGNTESIQQGTRERGAGEAGSIARSSRNMDWPPGPAGDWSDIDERYWPAVEPEVRRVAHGPSRGLAKTDRLRILGNGVVPQQAALAYEVLARRQLI